ncbi:hypothetical protein D3C71_1225540 [compost metagenome]
MLHLRGQAGARLQAILLGGERKVGGLGPLLQLAMVPERDALGVSFIDTLEGVVAPVLMVPDLDLSQVRGVELDLDPACPGAGSALIVGRSHTHQVVQQLLDGCGVVIAQTVDFDPRSTELAPLGDHPQHLIELTQVVINRDAVPLGILMPDRPRRHSRAGMDLKMIEADCFPDQLLDLLDRKDGVGSRIIAKFPQHMWRQLGSRKLAREKVV